MLDFFELHSYLYREIRQSDELWFVAPNNTLNSYRVNIPRNISDFWRQVEEIFLPMFTRKYSRKHWETYYHRALRHTTDVWFRISDFFYLFIYLFIYSFYVVRSLFPQYVGQPFFAADIVRDFLAELPSAWFQSRMANFFTGIEKELWNLMFFTENNSNTWTITSFSFIELNVFTLRMAFLFFFKKSSTSQRGARQRHTWVTKHTPLHTASPNKFHSNPLVRWNWNLTFLGINLNASAVKFYLTSWIPAHAFVVSSRIFLEYSFVSVPTLAHGLQTWRFLWWIHNGAVSSTFEIPLSKWTPLEHFGLFWAHFGLVMFV